MLRGPVQVLCPSESHGPRHVVDFGARPSQLLECSNQVDAKANIVGRMDYGPFGEQVTVSTVGHKSYAGLFRDGEAGLDYAEARSYQVRTGRFSAPDPVYAGMFQPQVWNRYSYALNAPLVFVDPTGMAAASSCVMKEFKLDGGVSTRAYDCSVTGEAAVDRAGISAYSIYLHR